MVLKHTILLAMLFVILIDIAISNSYAERDVTLSKTIPKIDDFAKISSTIQQWQSSPDPKVFAQKNNLTYSNGKITVYIYLDTPESISKLPQDLEIASSADDIAVAYLDSRQITQVAQLDFVERIDTPVLARPAPIPINGEFSDKSNLQPYYVIVIVIVIAASIVYLMKRKSKRFVSNYGE